LCGPDQYFKERFDLKLKHSVCFNAADKPWRLFSSAQHKGLLGELKFSPQDSNLFKVFHELKTEYSCRLKQRLQQQVADVTDSLEAQKTLHNNSVFKGMSHECSTEALTAFLFLWLPSGPIR